MSRADNGTAPDTTAAAGGPAEPPSEQQSGQPEQRSFISVIIHSFFIIPFLIAIFAGLLVVTWRILTNEPHSVYDYVADVKVGGATKRWQAAFELSKILADPDRTPDEQRFVGRNDRRVRRFRA